MMAGSSLNIHHIEPSSRTNGPGLRTVIWLQGCTLACPGCFNPETHPADQKLGVNWNELAQDLIEHQKNVDGITISGGEPLQQAVALNQFLNEIRVRSSLSVILFTGYSWKEILQEPDFVSTTRLTDVILAGRYNQKMRIAKSLIGSENKTIHFLTNRYRVADFIEIPEAEILISEDGTITSTGIDPIRFHL